jgi:hypothetical protein
MLVHIRKVEISMSMIEMQRNQNPNEFLEATRDVLYPSNLGELYTLASAYCTTSYSTQKSNLQLN